MRLLPLIACLLFFNVIYGQQAIEPPLHQRGDTVIPARLPPTDPVRRFYELVKAPYPWIVNKSLQEQLQQLFRQSAKWGLPEQDYPLAYLDSLLNGLAPLRDQPDTIAADRRLTVAALHFFHRLAIGPDIPPVASAGLRHMPDCIDIPGLLALAVSNLLLEQLPESMEPSTADYKTLKTTLHQLLEIEQDTTGNNIQALLTRLRALGIIPYALHAFDRQQIQQAIKGKVIDLQDAMNSIRWIRCLQEERVIVVNIPSATLDYYEQGKAILQSRVVVGKRSTPTRTLTSLVDEVVLYPYWTVPTKIASRELLPMIKRNPAFLQENNYQVIRNGKLIDPAGIDWKQYSSTNFPFTLRQSTGCDNSLGIIKLNFASPFGIYLHDTPWKSLFNAPKRYFSHGCIRVEKVAELARLILGADSAAFNAIVDKGDSLNTKPTPLRLAQPVPVVIVYHTAWQDLTGQVRYYEDVYRKNTRDGHLYGAR